MADELKLVGSWTYLHGDDPITLTVNHGVGGVFGPKYGIEILSKTGENHAGERVYALEREHPLSGRLAEIFSERVGLLSEEKAKLPNTAGELAALVSGTGFTKVEDMRIGPLELVAAKA